MRAFDALADAQERARAERMRLDEDRLRALAGRGALRHLLGGYLGRAGGALAFATTCPRCGKPHGKPRLEPPSGLLFGASHSGEWVLLGFRRGGDVAVDVESVARGPTLEDLASSLSPAEARRLRAAASGQTLLHAWTRKEAYLKLLGLGLAAPLDEVDIPAEDGPARLWAPPEEGGWREAIVRGIDLDAGHVAAIAYDPPEVRVRLLELTPKGATG